MLTLAWLALHDNPRTMSNNSNNYRQRRRQPRRQLGGDCSEPRERMGGDSYLYVCARVCKFGHLCVRVLPQCGILIRV